MNPDLQQLHPYPFEKLRHLLADLSPGKQSAVSLSVGEPKHPAPEFVLEAMTGTWRGVEQYPSTRGNPELLQAIADWLEQRFKLAGGSVSANTQILTVNGTREALFAIGQCVLDRTSDRNIALTPNPFYQIYEGSIYLAGLSPTFYNAASSNQQQPVFPAPDDPIWSQVQLLYICNPGNPTGSVLSIAELQELINLAQRHQFVIVSDECYSEVYRDEANPPPGLLQAASAMGNSGFEHCLVFHSLSKRSNLPGLRSGFVAGDADLIKAFLQYRTYHGCSMAPPTQAASLAAWRDEQHVVQNRAHYNDKYQAVVPILSDVMSVSTPDAGFYLWPDVGMDDEMFTRDLYSQYNVAVVPGSYLARTIDGDNPGSRHSRLALVAPLDDCVEAAERIRDYLHSRR